MQRRDKVTARILVAHNLPEWQVLEPDLEKQRLYRKLLAPYRAKVLSGNMRSVLTSIPTKRDAEVDGIAYKDYAELYFRMCDQPWDLIKAAQYKLIEKLNAGKILRFTNSDGTDLSMDIDGFTFCNSVIARNIPGSEVFSASKIDSTNGIIVAKGRFSPKDDAASIIENITLKFEKGMLVSYTAEKGQEILNKTLSVDAGAKRIGEIGIGTNPYLKQHVASILLSEKIGGSFHVALGDAYTMTDYMGDPVRVDNGNRSQLHWDITTMLHGKSGRMYLDGAVIMDDGVFLDSGLDVLNRGWQSVPFDQRPPEWQKIYPKP
jgi:aminopeptidase